MIHAFKYQGCRALADPFATLMREAGAPLLAVADVVVPVPLHPLRFLRRGFNQATDLAVRLGPPVWHALQRTRAGPPQADLAADDRLTNVRCAFSLRPSLSRRAPPSVVLLIDDVMTTGATMEACSRVLREAGVTTVFGLTTARAVAERPRQPPAPPHREAARRR